MTAVENIESLKQAKAEQPFTVKADEIEITYYQNMQSYLENNKEELEAQGLTVKQAAENLISKGVDLKDGVYQLKGNDGQNIILTESQLNTVGMNYRQEQARQQNSSENKVVNHKVNMRALSQKEANVADLAQKAGYYQPETNELHMNIKASSLEIAKFDKSLREKLADYYEDPEYKKKSTEFDFEDVQSLYQEGKLTKEEFGFYMFNYQSNTPKSKKDEIYKQTLAHENTHRQDAQKGYMDQANLSPTYLAKMNMCTEINANMSQVARLYDYYQEHGNFDKYSDDIVLHCGKLEEYEKYIAEHANDKDCKQQLAQKVYKGWLNLNNWESSSYYQQAIMTSNGAVSEAGSIVDTEETLREYHQRTDDMFQNTALGDVRSVVNPDFKLGKGREIENEVPKAGNEAGVFLQQMIAGEQTTFNATEKIAQLMAKIKQSAQDGVCTPEEQAEINKAAAPTQKTSDAIKLWVMKNGKTH